MINEENHPDRVIFDHKNLVNSMQLIVTNVPDYESSVPLMVNRLNQYSMQAKKNIYTLFRKKNYHFST